MVKTGGCKGEAMEGLKSFSEGRAKVVADSAAYLKERKEWEATGEILGNEGLVHQMRESRQAWAEDRKGEFVSLPESDNRHTFQVDLVSLLRLGCPHLHADN